MTPEIGRKAFELGYESQKSLTRIAINMTIIKQVQSFVHISKTFSQP